MTIGNNPENSTLQPLTRSSFDDMHIPMPWRASVIAALKSNVSNRKNLTPKTIILNLDTEIGLTATIAITSEHDARISNSHLRINQALFDTISAAFTQARKEEQEFKSAGWKGLSENNITNLSQHFRNQLKRAIIEASQNEGENIKFDWEGASYSLPRAEVKIQSNHAKNFIYLRGSALAAIQAIEKPVDKKAALKDSLGKQTAPPEPPDDILVAEIEEAVGKNKASLILSLHSGSLPPEEDRNLLHNAIERLGAILQDRGEYGTRSKINRLLGLGRIAARDEDKGFYTFQIVNLHRPLINYLKRKSEQLSVSIASIEPQIDDEVDTIAGRWHPDGGALFSTQLTDYLPGIITKRFIQQSYGKLTSPSSLDAPTDDTRTTWAATITGQQKGPVEEAISAEDIILIRRMTADADPRSLIGVIMRALKAGEVLLPELDKFGKPVPDESGKPIVTKPKSDADILSFCGIGSSGGRDSLQNHARREIRELLRKLAKEVDFEDNERGDLKRINERINERINDCAEELTDQFINIFDKTIPTGLSASRNPPSRSGR